MSSVNLSHILEQVERARPELSAYTVCNQRGNRRKKFLDDLAHLNRLPDQPLDTDDIVKGAAESRGNGGVVHTSGGTLRTRERTSDEQPCVQQVGPDLQGCDDNSRSDRPPGPSQCDHRTQRLQLPSGDSKNHQNETNSIAELENPNGNSSCR